MRPATRLFAGSTLVAVTVTAVVVLLLATPTARADTGPAMLRAMAASDPPGRPPRAESLRSWPRIANDLHARWSPARTRPRICAGPPGLAGHDRSGVRRRQRSGRARSSEGQVEGLLEAERHALGVGPLQLLIAQVRARLVQAVPAVARVELLPRNPVRSRSACAAPCSAAARSQSPASPARHARPRQAPAMPLLSPFRRLIRRAASNMDRAPSRSPSARNTRPRFAITVVFWCPICCPACAAASR